MNITLNGHPVTGVQAELAFQQWFLSIETCGWWPEDTRNALKAQQIFHFALSDKFPTRREFNRAIVARAGVQITD